MVMVGKVVALVATGMNPESKLTVPGLTDRAVQGSAKELCVTVWFFWWNWNVTVSPI